MVTPKSVVVFRVSLLRVSRSARAHVGLLNKQWSLFYKRRKKENKTMADQERTDEKKPESEPERQAAAPPPAVFGKDPGFPGRGRRGGWKGPLIDYKEVELIRRFLTGSSKIMSRKRSSTNTQEQRALKLAVKRARFLALIPYSGS